MNAMEKLLEKLLDVKKVPTTLLLVLLFSSGVLLFAPEEFLSQLNLTEFKEEYGKYIGITFIVTSAFLSVAVFSLAFQVLRKTIWKSGFKRKIEESIRTLDPHEKALLREFFIHRKKTLDLPAFNETVIGLQNKGVINQMSSNGLVYVHGAYFSYCISDYAYRFLSSQILDLPDDPNPTESDIRRIHDNRPQWAIDKARFAT